MTQLTLALFLCNSSSMIVLKKFIYFLQKCCINVIMIVPNLYISDIPSVNFGYTQTRGNLLLTFLPSCCY